MGLGLSSILGGREKLCIYILIFALIIISMFENLAVKL